MLSVGQANPPLLRDLATMVHSVMLLLSLPALPPKLQIWSHYQSYEGEEGRTNEEMKESKKRIGILANDWLKDVLQVIASQQQHEEASSGSSDKNSTSSSSSSSSVDGTNSLLELTNANGSFEVLVGPMLVLTAHESGLPVSRHQLSTALAKILSYIVTSVSPPPLPLITSSAMQSSTSPTSSSSTSTSASSSFIIPEEFIKKNEISWRDTVRPHHNTKLMHSYHEVNVKLKQLEDAIKNDFPSSLEITFDSINNMLLLRKDPATLTNVTLNKETGF